MNINQLLLSELKQEYTNTKKNLRAIPSEKFTWKSHEKSMNISQLAHHIYGFNRKD